jgi:hypothetical protein
MKNITYAQKVNRDAEDWVPLDPYFMISDPNLTSVEGVARTIAHTRDGWKKPFSEPFEEPLEGTEGTLDLSSERDSFNFFPQ